MNADFIDELVSQYLKLFPEERSNLAGLIEQIVNGDELNNRKTLPGHITGSAFVLSPERTQVLLIFHKYLQKWLQLGGHWEADEPTPLQAAKREAHEESGVHITEQLYVNDLPNDVPFDIDVHFIPANPAKDELDHYHYDFRYVFTTDRLTLDTKAAEYSDAQWIDLSKPAELGRERVMAKLQAYSDI